MHIHFSYSLSQINYKYKTYLNFSLNNEYIIDIWIYKNIWVYKKFYEFSKFSECRIFFIYV